MNTLLELELMEFWAKGIKIEKVNGSSSQKRNLDCKNYNLCLDFAADNFWDGFSCEKCRLKDSKASLNLPLSNLNPGIRYQLPAKWNII